MLWEVDIYPQSDQAEGRSRQVAAEAADLHLAADLSVRAAQGYLIQGQGLTRADVEMLTRELLADGVVQQTVIAPVGDAALNEPPVGYSRQVQVLPKPGVMDPVAQSAQRAIADLGIQVDTVRTLAKYWLDDVSDQTVAALSSRVLANDAIEQVIVGPLPFDHLELGSNYEFELVTVPIRQLDDAGLMKLSREGQLYLQLAEMQTIAARYRELDRDPTDIELETLAQTWSEHCSHKTLAGRIAYRDPDGERQFDNMLKETIFAATQQIRKDLGEEDWCVSVFKDNAGIVRFDDDYNVVFKVETHNHPSALEPYGGANTGIGGVIRDPLGTGLGAKPICNTDVFCFAPPDMAAEDLPLGVLHPRRVMKGVVSGVRDYGNRMGIPTVNGAVYFDKRYLGNPLVYCGNAGLIPRDKSFGDPQPGDMIVAMGGRTGRDGIHGATFSSTELTSQSEDLSGGAVQIGNAITEKMVLDVVLAARDRGLYNAITDCGAGGFSSAVGEMGEKIGAEVWLDRAPLKYDGLSYTEIWISEAQERMVLAVSEAQWGELSELCASEGVEAVVIGKFAPTGRLKLLYDGRQVGDLAMEFLHDGRPPVVRQAEYQPPNVAALALPERADFTSDLLKILGSLNVASKHWIIRQYDHEVQGGSAIKPLVGVANDGPGDAAVVRPVLGSRRGIVISCGMNPHYGEFDTYHMATSAIDEALRNCVAVGADPSRIAILDNFCWGDCEKSETLGSLVRAAVACYDLAVALGAPFISGKDSLNNEFSYEDAGGNRQTIAIPPSLLISALGQVDDVAKCVTMDLKQAGNLLYLVGETKEELGGSHFALVNELTGGAAPRVDADAAKRTFAAMHAAIVGGTVRACHDLSEGGLAVAAAEMAFAGGLGAALEVDRGELPIAAALFSESNTRFLCEVSPEKAEAFESQFTQADVSIAEIGVVTTDSQFTVKCDSAVCINESISVLKETWQAPLDW
jgi:phosphoribosylformylglycinamidine synthase